MEHDAITEHKFLRKRTQAKQRLEAAPLASEIRLPVDGRKIVEIIRCGNRCLPRSPMVDVEKTRDPTWSTEILAG
jgi:hypothetical protein